MQSLRSLLRWVVQALLSLRYRVRVHGTEPLRDVRGPVLILPNHPGFTDPTIVMTALDGWLRPRPVFYEEYFQNPFIYPFAKLVRAVRVPNLGRASVEARQKVEQAIAELTETLRRGDSVILWPAGHVQRDGVERLGGARTAADLVRAVPDVQVVLVRTRGLWGSRFSYGYTGSRPHFVRLLAKCAGLLVSNLLVFMPRRPVEIFIEPVPAGALPEARRETLNPWLEAWYNADGPEDPAFAPYHFLLGPRTRVFPQGSAAAPFGEHEIRPDTKAAVAHILAQRLGRPLTAGEEQATTTFDQFGLDSLDLMEITLAVEQQSGFHGDHVPVNLGQLWALAQGLAERAPPKPAPLLWFQPPSAQGPLSVLGNTIPEAFVRRAQATPKDVAVADDLSGVLTYERLLVGAMALARQFRKLPAANVGLMLPASVACDVAFLGLHLAGKLPVLLNWTTGPANLAHAAQLMGLSEVITSRAFIDRTGVSVEGVRFLFLEDLRRQTNRLWLLQALLMVRFWPQHDSYRVPPEAAHQSAVVLFTSGSERTPKAVPLTHANILADILAGIPHLRFHHGEAVLGFLPAFHSFGLVVTSLLPIIGGMRVVHHPDPTDAAGLARKIAAYRPSLVLGTPTFIGYIVDRAEPGELLSLERIIVGAEKCPPALIEAVARAAPRAVVLEGYGITECSPVVACNQVEANRPGTVGHPMPGVDVCAVDLETEEKLPRGRLGMLWVHGPTVFPGYFGEKGESPFRERNGRRWYVTGDLAEIDVDGYIRLAGRLKRFLKAGGEMISLPALEEPFARRIPPTDDGPRVAVEGVERIGGRRIVLFTTDAITLAEANAILLQEGFRGVMRLDDVRHLERIPTLGTGKVDYKVLRAQIEAEPRP